MRLLRLFNAVTILISLNASPAFPRSGEHLTTSNFSDVAKTISTAVSTYGAHQVLLALDIDNTTLETEKDLGSEHWFLWQSKLIRDGHLDEGAVTNKISDVLELQAHIISLSSMKPVEPSIPMVLSQYGAIGTKMIALTSRGLSMHDATLRELSVNEFPYARFAPGPEEGYAGTYMPYNLAHMEDSGLSQEDITKFDLKESRPVIYDRGVYLTAGQHKGVMLRALLHKIRRNFKAIIFVDDRLHHSEGMRAAFADRPEVVTTIQYTRTAGKVEKFATSDKREVKESWCEFARALRVTEGSTPRIPYLACDH